MTGIVLVTHNGIGDCLVHEAENIIGEPVNIGTVAISYDAEPDQAREALRAAFAVSDDGDGLLILTDLPGATPHNLALDVARESGVQVVSGLNLPMLLKVLNYARLAPEPLADKARRGGSNGIRLETANERK